jgi:hypothetical protein
VTYGDNLGPEAPCAQDVVVPKMSAKTEKKKSPLGKAGFSEIFV